MHDQNDAPRPSDPVAGWPWDSNERVPGLRADDAASSGSPTLSRFKAVGVVLRLPAGLRVPPYTGGSPEDSLRRTTAAGVRLVCRDYWQRR